MNYRAVSKSDWSALKAALARCPIINASLAFNSISSSICSLFTPKLPCKWQWSTTVTAGWCMNAFDQWCLQDILRIPYTAHISNLTIGKQTKQCPVTSAILKRRLKLSGHIARSCPPGHFNLHQLSTRGLSRRPHQSWLQIIRGDLKTQNTSLSSAWHTLHRRSCWHRVDKRASHLMMMKKTVTSKPEIMLCEVLWKMSQA